ncbi:hypothetical protein GY45DRAFT_1360864 [Cubamyces sp. BRFM 1775]|nr:hypothetical protein GY45DRAFT_1360864 [Cubamyces sp. BRFM 1775]
MKGFKTVNLAFLLTSGPADQVAKWAALSPDQRQKLKQQYNGAGVPLVLSAFGETDKPMSQDHTAVANTEFMLVTKQLNVAEAWLTTLTQTLRQQLPQGQFILSHAPVGPWFQPGFCPGGCYLTVTQNVGPLLDWYNVQFYNQSPSSGYEDCNTLLNSAGGYAVFEIQKKGVDMNKIVIGKHGEKEDAPSGGFIDPATLGTCIRQAVSNGWNAGVMEFEFSHANTDWIATVKGSAFA